MGVALRCSMDILGRQILSMQGIIMKQKQAPPSPTLINKVLELPKAVHVRLKPDALTKRHYDDRFPIHRQDGSIIKPLRLKIFFTKWPDGHLKSIQLSIIFKDSRIFGLDMEPIFKVHHECKSLEPLACFSKIRGSHKQVLIAGDKYIRFIETPSLWNLFTLREILSEFFTEANIVQHGPQGLFNQSQLHYMDETLRLKDDHHAGLE